jgi:dCTP deaminase
MLLPEEQKDNLTFWFEDDFRNWLGVILPIEDEKQDDFSSEDIDWVKDPRNNRWTNHPRNKRFQPSSLELTLGKEVFISSKKELKILNEKDRHIKIPAGDFALLITREYIKIPPNCMGFIAIKTRYKFEGLINISGFHVDPGFEGKLKFSVFNAGSKDVILTYMDPIFIIFITFIRGTSTTHDGEHTKQRHIEAKDMDPLLGAQVPLYDLSHRLRDLETKVKIYGGLLGGMLIAILVFLLNWALTSHGGR